MPRLRILAGPSLSDLKEIRANSGQAAHIATDAFEGDVAVYVKNFADTDGDVPDSVYFEERKDVTWSIQVRGRFLQEHSADDILFGNVFDKPLPIPWGFSAILSFMQYMDPCLEHDLQSKAKPWALSPLISTMPYFAHTQTDVLNEVLPFPPPIPVQEDTSQLRFKDGERPVELQDTHSPASRRAYCKDPEHRKNILFGPNDTITTDFCYGYLSFSPTGVVLQLPAGMTFDMMRYWDGQPVYFVCCSRAAKDEIETGHPLKVFWCVAIEVLQGEEEDADAEGDLDDDDNDELVNDDVD